MNHFFFSLMLLASLSPDQGLNKLPKIIPVDQSQPNLKNTPARLTAAEIRLHMQSLSDWTTDGEHLMHTRTFENFVEAIAFVNNLVGPAEQLGHHPDITISYNQVSLKLTTHDAEGLTELDFQLAQKISKL